MEHIVVRTPARALGTRVREARLDSGLSQERLAELAGLHPSNVGRIERGAVNPSLETIAYLARALGSTVSELTEYVTVPSPPMRPADGPGN